LIKETLYPEQFYQHLKTFGIYKIITLAKDEKTSESLVVYGLVIRRDGSVDKEKIWVRPESEFREKFKSLNIE
jgi:hypothetical protein